MESVISQLKCSEKLIVKYPENPKGWTQKTISNKVREGAITEYSYPPPSKKRGVKFTEVEALFLFENPTIEETENLFDVIGQYSSVADMTAEELENLQLKEDIGLLKKELNTIPNEEKTELEEPTDSDFVGISLNSARAEKEYWLGRLAKLKTMKEEREVILKEEVMKQASSLGKELHDKLLRLPIRLAPLIVSLTDRRSIEAILKDEITTILTELYIENIGEIDE